MTTIKSGKLKNLVTVIYSCSPIKEQTYCVQTFRVIRNYCKHHKNELQPETNTERHGMERTAHRHDDIGRLGRAGVRNRETA